MSLPRAILDHARKRLDAAHADDDLESTGGAGGGVVCQLCRRWVKNHWHRTLDRTDICYGCAPEEERRKVAAKLAGELVRSNLIPAEVWDRAEAEAANA